MGVSTYVPHQEFGGWISQAGKDFGELAITKPLDSGSDLILEAATSGRNLEYVILYCEQVTATGSVQTYYTVLLHNAVVSWYNRFEDRKDNSIFETMRFDPTEVMIKPLRH
jgi:type VI protein secretion system component Hcp